MNIDSKKILNITLSILLSFACFISFLAFTKIELKNEEQEYIIVGYDKIISKSIDSKLRLVDQINANLAEMREKFSIEVSDFKDSMLPENIVELERNFISSLKISNKKTDKGKYKLNFTVEYNDAGKAVLELLYGIKIKTTDRKAIEIREFVKPLINRVKNKTQYLYG